jgi:aminomethyltransferase
LEEGADLGIVPVGLGARDTLRLEASYPLHGHEIRDDLNASYSGLGWVIKPGKGDFIGKAALAQKGSTGALQLVGLEVTGRGVVRADSELFCQDQKIGWVTSGTFTPSLQKAVAMAYLPLDYSKVGTELEADVRSRRIGVKVVPLPFYKRS